ncbi:MAG: hypothetical protein APR63_08090 [Desulfuromonas sp. SDB]|nr:MAG: hypothetical protein APR63_08090 [Desulfuromonas sp. SDB]
MKYIFGFGSYYRGDDSIGIRICEQIILRNLEDGFKSVVVGNNGSLFLSLVEQCTHKVLIVDSADMGKLPGEYLIFSPDQVKSKKLISNFSTHEGDVLKLIYLAEKIYGQLPPVEIMGIQPKCLNSGELSPELDQNFEKYLQKAIYLIKH